MSWSWVIWYVSKNAWNKSFSKLLPLTYNHVLNTKFLRWTWYKLLGWKTIASWFVYRFTNTLELCSNQAFKEVLVSHTFCSSILSMIPNTTLAKSPLQSNYFYLYVFSFFTVIKLAIAWNLHHFKNWTYSTFQLFMEQPVLCQPSELISMSILLLNSCMV